MVEIVDLLVLVVKYNLTPATTTNTCVEFDPDKGRVSVVYNDGTSGDGKS